MAIKIRPNPPIPDHEVLRKIGGGAYGEVWLARGVTGALRAVKVVWREDFEDERTFEREFEGILKFEPISRNHPALVNILAMGLSIPLVTARLARVVPAPNTPTVAPRSALFPPCLAV